MAKKGFGSEIYFQDKFNEFDWATRYNRMSPKEGFAQMWKDYKNSIKMEEDEWGKPPPIPSSFLKSGLGFILKQLAGSKFSNQRRDFLESIIKLKPKIKIDSPKPFKFSDVGKGSKFFQDMLKKVRKGAVEDALGKPKRNGNLKNWDIKGKTKHAEGGIAGMLGEPRSGYNEGKEAKNKVPWYLWPYRRGQEWDKILEKLFKAKEIDPEDYIINVADGGRIGLKGGGGGYQDYWAMVQDSSSFFGIGFNFLF